MADKTDAEKLTEALTKITGLEQELKTARASVTTSANDLEKVRNEAATHRTARNKALRINHALSTVFKAHNIEFDVDKADLGGLVIADGAVAGEFEYTAPAAKKPDVTKQAPDEGKPLTLDVVKGMTPQQINANWKEVSKVLEGGA